MSMKMKFALLVALALVSAGCAQKVDVTKAKADLQAADSNASGAATNAESFAALFLPDAEFLPPNEPAVVGPDNVRTWASKMMGAPGFSVSWKPTRVEVAASGDLGVTAGTYELSMQGPAGAPIHDNGKYLTTWKKDATGKWKIAIDTFNSDLPAMGAAPADTSKTAPMK